MPPAKTTQDGLLDAWGRNRERKTALSLAKHGST